MRSRTVRALARGLLLRPHADKAGGMVKMACLTVVILVFAGCSSPPGEGSAESANGVDPRSLNVVLTPRVEAGQIQALSVRLKLEKPEVEAGKVLLRMPIELVSTPTAAYLASEIHVRDQRGRLTLRAEDQKPTSTGQQRNYIASRSTVGDVVVEYATPPRPVDASTRNGPLFDLRAQDGGLMGAGVYFMALPPGEQPRDIHLRWDLSALPEAARGVWSLGEGEQETTAPATLLRFSFYAVGVMNRYPANDGATFQMYWMNDPPFNVDALAKTTGTLYHFMAAFFQDEGSVFRVFARQNPYPAGGGTALAHSFMFGYGPQGQTIAEGLQPLLAHEMAHTWPKLDGDAHSLTAWYTEGTAEFYSPLLSLRSGVTDQKQFLRAINVRADNYYENPYRDLSNAAASKLFWSDARAQSVPYGRGFMYLVDVDAKLRRHGRHADSLDDLVMEVLQRQRAGEKVGVDEWRAMVVRELGEDAGIEFDAMVAGKLVIPEAPAFGCFAVLSDPHRPFELGFDRMLMGVVTDLLPDSAAAQAGVKEGDKILYYTPLDDAAASEDATMTLELLRHGKKHEITYVPRGEEVTAWAFVRSAKYADSCKP